MYCNNNGLFTEGYIRDGLSQIFCIYNWIQLTAVQADWNVTVHSKTALHSCLFCLPAHVQLPNSITKETNNQQLA